MIEYLLTIFQENNIFDSCVLRSIPLENNNPCFLLIADNSKNAERIINLKTVGFNRVSINKPFDFAVKKRLKYEKDIMLNLPGYTLVKNDSKQSFYIEVFYHQVVRRIYCNKEVLA